MMMMMMKVIKVSNCFLLTVYFSKMVLIIVAFALIIEIIFYQACPFKRRCRGNGAADVR